MKYKKLINGIVVALLAISNVAALPNATTRAATNTIQNIQRVDGNISEDFNNVPGHDDQHPIWPVNQMGVVVDSDNPELQNAVQKACEDWTPVFRFDYIASSQAKQRINSSTNDDYRVFIREGSLPPSKLGVTHNPGFINGWFNGMTTIIIIDVAKIDSHDPQMLETVVAHELGHVIGLKHSTNKQDVMYKSINHFKQIQPEEFALVKRLYNGRNLTTFPDKKPVVPIIEQMKKQHYTAMDGNGGLNLLSQISRNLKIVDKNNSPIKLRTAMFYKQTLKRSKKNYTHMKGMLPNGTYIVKSRIKLAGLPRSNKKQILTLVSDQSSLKNLDNIAPTINIASIKVPAKAIKVSHYITFKVKINGNYYKVLS